MDERLVGEYEKVWENGIPPISQLCRFAVIYARLDREQSTTSGEDDIMTPYLGNILELGFHPIGMPEIVAGDYDRLTERLLAANGPRVQQRIAQSIGDRLLFFTSQDSRVGRSTEHSLSLDGMIGLGSTAYTVAAAHADQRRQEFLHFIFSQLANEWPAYQSLLASAGQLLGFEDTSPLIIRTSLAPATMENLLEAISRYGKEPSQQHWEDLADIVYRRTRSDPDFHYKLPPRPEA